MLSVPKPHLLLILSKPVTYSSIVLLVGLPKPLSGSTIALLTAVLLLFWLLHQNHSRTDCAFFRIGHVWTCRHTEILYSAHTVGGIRRCANSYIHTWNPQTKPTIKSVSLEVYLVTASPADIRKVCVWPPALRKLRTYDVDFLNDAWRTPPDATAWPMASSHRFTHPHQVSARLTPPLWCCAVPLLLPVRAKPYGRLCTTRVSVLP